MHRVAHGLLWPACCYASASALLSLLPGSTQAEDEPLLIGQLRIPPAAEDALRRCWGRLGTRSLYRSFEQYRQLVAEVRHPCNCTRARSLRACSLRGVCADGMQPMPARLPEAHIEKVP